MKKKRKTQRCVSSASSSKDRLVPGASGFESPFDRELSGLDEIRLFVTFVLTFLFIRDILHSERGRARICARVNSYS